MIGRLRGELAELDGALALIDVAGVGYEVSIPSSVLAQLPPCGSPVALFIRQLVREDSVTLYGFSTAWSRRLFDVLLGVKGCGPKVALALLGTTDEAGIVRAVTMEDAKALARAPGVGTRLAERIILETKDKLAEEAALHRVSHLAKPPEGARDELIDALLALGYRPAEAEGAAADARARAETLPEQIRFATQALRR